MVSGLSTADTPSIWELSGLPLSLFPPGLPTFLAHWILEERSGLLGRAFCLFFRRHWESMCTKAHGATGVAGELGHAQLVWKHTFMAVHGITRPFKHILRVALLRLFFSSHAKNELLFIDVVCAFSSIVSYFRALFNSRLLTLCAARVFFLCQARLHGMKNDGVYISTATMWWSP